MKITDTRIRLAKLEDSKVKAFASITIDDAFAVHNIKVIQGTESLFISMPNKKLPNGEFKDICHAINSETRQQITDAVIQAYEAELNKAE